MGLVKIQEPLLKGGVRVCNFEKIDFFLSYLIVKHFKNIFPKF